MITFSKDLEIGVSLIDEQHKNLVDRLNTITYMGLKSTLKEETQKTIDLLGEYVIKHFNDEEELQKTSGYPKYELHKEQHKLFIKEFIALKKEFETNGNSTKFTSDLSKSVTLWILRHIQGDDYEFGRFYNKVKTN